MYTAIGMYTTIITVSYYIWILDRTKACARGIQHYLLHKWLTHDSTVGKRCKIVLHENRALSFYTCSLNRTKSHDYIAINIHTLLYMIVNGRNHR